MVSNNDDWQDVDDWQDIPAQPQAKAGPKSTAPQAFARGVVDTSTMGYSPQIAGGAQAMADKALQLAGKVGVGPYKGVYEMGAESQLPSTEDVYLQGRDQSIAEGKQMSEEHPGASLAGKGVGIMATAPLALGNVGRAGGALAQMGKGAAVGAAQGAVYNPGDEAGVINPAQGMERVKNAAAGAAIGAPLAGVGAGVKALANKSRMVERVKDSANLSKNVKQEIDSALQGVTANEVKPRADKLTELLQGKSVEVNPDRIKGISPGLNSLASRMASKADENGRRAMSAPRAQKLRQLLDARADYAQAKPFDTAGLAKGESAKKAADIVRSKLSALDPQVGELNDKMSEAIRLRNALSRASKSAPISSIKGSPGTDKGSLIDAIDKMGGSKLEKLSSDIQSAKDLLINPANFVKPLEMPNEVRKSLVRGAAGTARGAEAVAPKGLDRALVQALMEANRKK